MPLTIVAIIESMPGHELEVETALLNLVQPTLAETGCLQYDLHRDHQNPDVFLFFENWVTRSDWEVHMESDHLAIMKQATAGKTRSTVIHQMEKVNPAGDR